MCDIHNKRDNVVVLLCFSCHTLSILTSARWEITVHIILEKSGGRCTESVIQMSKQCVIPVPSMNVPTDQVKGKAIPLQALIGPEGSRRLRLPDFQTIGT
jgi:hypothetical protein